MLRRFGLRCTSISEYNEGNFRAERRALSGFVTPGSGRTVIVYSGPTIGPLGMTTASGSVAGRFIGKSPVIEVPNEFSPMVGGGSSF